MTVEDKKGYEIAKKYLEKKYGGDYVDFIETEGQSYLDGYVEGRKEKWHDLRKDPDDLPEESKQYWCKFKDGRCNTKLYLDKPFWKIHWKDLGIIAWCECPQFEE